MTKRPQPAPQNPRIFNPLSSILSNLEHSFQGHRLEQKNLSKEDRIELPKMGDKTVAFVSKAQEYAQNNPDLVPSFLDMDALNSDVKMAKKLGVGRKTGYG